MLKLSAKSVSAAAGIVLLAAPVPALAAHGEPGLWQITITIGGNAHMPDLSKLPPDVQARMKAMGVGAGGNSITVQSCKTSEDFALHKLPSLGSHAKDCTISNYSESGNHSSVDLSCSGKFSGTGHVETVWDSGDHFTSEIALTGTHNGQTMTNSEKIEGRLISAQCGGTGH
ncbi:MAG: DUF3617 domain-containing protein [Rhizomicrobium sp.]